MICSCQKGKKDAPLATMQIHTRQYHNMFTLNIDGPTDTLILEFGLISPIDDGEVIASNFL